jgi:hypothetical protein
MEPTTLDEIRVLADEGRSEIERGGTEEARGLLLKDLRKPVGKLRRKK